MKKLLTFIGVVALSFTLFNNVVNAEAEMTNFQDAVTEEIDLFSNAEGYESYIKKLKAADFSNYKESEDKVNVYLFRGSSCGHCLEAIVFFTSLLKDYGDKFNLVTYEVWSNQDNATLMTKVADYFNEEVNGVPYIIIGDKTYQGYASSYDSEIIANIKDNYKNDDYEDVVAKVISGEAKSSKKTKSDNKSTIIIIAVIIIGFAAMVYLARDPEMDDEIEEVVPKKVEEKKTTETKKTTPKKTSTAKKTTTKKSSSAKKTTSKKTKTTK